MSKAFIIDPGTIAAVRAGYRRPLDRSELADIRKHVRGIDQPFFPGELRARFANIDLMDGAAVSVDTFSFTSDKKFPLGTMAQTVDGRIFRYASIGGSDSVAGTVLQSAAPIANHLALTSAAQAIGDGMGKTPIVVTPGATAGAANLYEDGFLGVDTTPGAGLNLRISGHPAITSSVAFNLSLVPDDLLPIAFTTATRYGLLHNPYKNAIIAATTVTAPAVGVAPIAQTTAYYGWLQTRGAASVLINGTPGVGIGLVTSATTAGALDVAAVAAEINVRIIARARQVCVSTKYNHVFLTLD